MKDVIRLGNCTVERHNGSFCDAPSAPDMPFPICGKHAIRIYRRIKSLMDEATADPLVSATLLLEMVNGAKAADAERLAQLDEPVVYYIRVGGLVKIGTTRKLSARLNQYPPGAELLGTEPGGPDVEQERHQQFAHLLNARKEWFQPDPDLLEFISGLTPKPPRQRRPTSTRPPSR